MKSPNLYSYIFQHILSRLDAERIHEIALDFLRTMGNNALARDLISTALNVRDERLVVNTLGLRFPNPLGIAAGFDKNAQVVPGLSALGFGFVEVGTVTPLPQAGNPRPRMFRLVEDQAIINRLGFPNKGCNTVRDNLNSITPSDVVIGTSIGKGKETPLEIALQDYAICMNVLYPQSDFFVVNVSSPNTPQLRALQSKQYLPQLLTGLVDFGRNVAAGLGTQEKPVLVKISPDLTLPELDEILDAITLSGISGIVATNTTVQREGLTSHHSAESGGLSGKPLATISTKLIRHIFTQTNGTLPVIGVGGIATLSDVLEKLAAGATLVQMYTGFIYQGPSIVSNINAGLLHLMDLLGMTSLTELVGNVQALDEMRAKVATSSLNRR